MTAMVNIDSIDGIPFGIIFYMVLDKKNDYRSDSSYSIIPDTFELIPHITVIDFIFNDLHKTGSS